MKKKLYITNFFSLYLQNKNYCMSLSIAEIRRIIERHPLPDKHLNDILQQWMIELAEELADNLLENVEASEKLASKEDIKQLIE
jgi:DNA-binding transcriptional MerR regulator